MGQLPTGAAECQGEYIPLQQSGGFPPSPLIKTYLAQAANDAKSTLPPATHLHAVPNGAAFRGTYALRRAWQHNSICQDLRAFGGPSIPTADQQIAQNDLLMNSKGERHRGAVFC